MIAIFIIIIFILSTTLIAAISTNKDSDIKITSKNFKDKLQNFVNNLKINRIWLVLLLPTDQKVGGSTPPGFTGNNKAYRVFNFVSLFLFAYNLHTFEKKC